MKQANFRKFKTMSGEIIEGGKNAEQNEELVKRVKPTDIVFHTQSAGSPFCVIGEKEGKANKNDIKEAALFCARYSREWKQAKNKKDIIVHYFKGKDIFKEKNMKIGMFGVKKFRTITAKKGDIEKI